ncbi:MAG TPA: hypothetical protein VF257_00580 [Solirubrobacteraceae bacterium]
MFERFRKTSATRREEEGAVAVREREEVAPATVAEPRREPEPATVAERQPEPAAVAEPEPEREAEPAAVAEPEPVAEPATTVDDERRTFAPVVGEETVAAMHDRQRVRFGGISWGSAFFGLLSAIGLAAMLLSIVAAAGVAIGVSEIENVANGDAKTIGLGGAILVLAILALSWFCGGYVAGRMARFDGMRQGIGVWAWTLLLGIVLAIAAVIGGSEYDVFAQLNLPNVAVGDQTLTTGGAITLAAALVVTLVCAIAGGKFGDRFHRRVDRFAAREYVETA